MVLDLQCDLTGGIGRLELGVDESRSFLRSGVAAATVDRVVTVVASVIFVATRIVAFLLRGHRCAVNKCDELTFERIPP